MSAWLTYIDWIAARPWVVYVLAPLLGLLSSVALTQAIKLQFPRRWRGLIRRWSIRAIAFVIAAGVTWFLAPNPTVGAALALVVGITSPSAYWLAEKRWPWISDLGA